MTIGPYDRKQASEISFRTARASDLLYSLCHSPTALIATVVLGIIIAAAALADLIAPYTPFDPASLDLMNGFTPPLSVNPTSGDFFLLGADGQGRDVLSTILFGTRLSLLVGAAAVVFAASLGVTIGLVSGYVGGWFDAVVMRIADVQLSFPAILVALLVFGIARGFVPPTERGYLAIWVLIVSIGLAEWVSFARVVRGATMSERNKEYVLAARLIGQSPWRIMTMHILPNVTGPVLVVASLGLALAVIAEATLSFLGVGVPPTEPSLGTLIRVGQGFLFSGEWWILLFPALTLIALVLSVNLIGDWLRQILDPRLGQLP